MHTQRANDRSFAGMMVTLAILGFFGLLALIDSCGGSGGGGGGGDRRGSCVASADHRPSLDPMSAAAGDLRDAGYLVGSDGAGGSCVKKDSWGG